MTGIHTHNPAPNAFAAHTAAADAVAAAPVVPRDSAPRMESSGATGATCVTASSHVPESDRVGPPESALLGNRVRDRRRPGRGAETRSAHRADGSVRGAWSGQAERRQFGDSHSGLSADGRELAAAIDAYKMAHHRRYITCDEMLKVIRELGYRKLDH